MGGTRQNPEWPILRRVTSHPRLGYAVNACLIELQEYEHTIDPRALTGEAVDGWYLEHLLTECAKKQGAILVAELDRAVAGFVAVQAKVTCANLDEQRYEYAHVTAPRL